ncbi:hypothetical protein B7494_g6498 [Chlorociboria aeruginascens]|nr:hypothetical protein B7494_g6498 [Chlorociboria aeruginascens]
MNLFTLSLALFMQVLAAAAQGTELIDSTTVYIQSISTSSTPATPLAEIRYNPSLLSAEIVSFDLPELSSDSTLVRIGIYDESTSSWKSSTSMTSAESFSKGYRPTIVLNLDGQGDVLGVSVKSGKIDAGETRDFGPIVKVVKMGIGKQPDLNRPVVLSPEGKVEQPMAEKTFLQKYWWVLLGATMLVATTGAGGDS